MGMNVEGAQPTGRAGGAQQTAQTPDADKALDKAIAEQEKRTAELVDQIGKKAAEFAQKAAQKASSQESGPSKAEGTKPETPPKASEPQAADSNAKPNDHAGCTAKDGAPQPEAPTGQSGQPEAPPKADESQATDNKPKPNDSAAGGNQQDQDGPPKQAGGCH